MDHQVDKKNKIVKILIDYALNQSLKWLKTLTLVSLTINPDWVVLILRDTWDWPDWNEPSNQLASFVDTWCAVTQTGISSAEDDGPNLGANGTFVYLSQFLTARRMNYLDYTQIDFRLTKEIGLRTRANVRREEILKIGTCSTPYRWVVAIKN